MFKAGIPALSAMAFAATAPISVHAKVVSHFNGNGAYASVYDYGSDGMSINLYVTQGGTRQAAETYLDFSTSNCDSLGSACEGVSGWGLIPNNSFSASAKSATLSVNLSGLPGFNAVQWRYDWSTGSYSESPIDPGTISSTWKSSGLSSQKFIGTSTSTYLNTTLKSTGQSSYSDAVANVSILGQQLGGAYGSIGTNSNNDRTMERK